MLNQYYEIPTWFWLYPKFGFPKVLSQISRFLPSSCQKRGHGVTILHPGRFFKADTSFFAKPLTHFFSKAMKRRRGVDVWFELKLLWRRLQPAQILQDAMISLKLGGKMPRWTSCHEAAAVFAGTYFFSKHRTVSPNWKLQQLHVGFKELVAKRGKCIFAKEILKLV